MSRWLKFAMAALLAAHGIGGYAASEISAGSSGETDRALDQVEAEVRSLLAEGQLEQIARILEDEWREEARLPDGRWRENLRRTFFSGGLASRWHTSAEWAAGIKQLKAVASKRNSAWLLVAEAQYARAWQLRGSDYARNVPPDAMAGYRQWMQRTLSTLEDHRAELNGYGAWHDLRLSVALESGESREAQRKLFVEGLLRFPRYQPLYFNRMRELLPQWGGSEEEILDLLDDIARSTDPRMLSEGLYARVLWYSEGVGVSLQWDPRINAQALQGSIDALVSTYPAQWNVQRMFLFNCQRGDKPNAQKLMPLLQDPPESSMLGKSVPLYQRCREWAAGRLDSFVIGYQKQGREAFFLVH